MLDQQLLLPLFPSLRVDYQEAFFHLDSKLRL